MAVGVPTARRSPPRTCSGGLVRPSPKCFTALELTFSNSYQCADLELMLGHIIDVIQILCEPQTPSSFSPGGVLCAHTVGLVPSKAPNLKFCRRSIDGYSCPGCRNGEGKL